jgi:N-acetylglucosamine-6-phosphate deacetylase
MLACTAATLMTPSEAVNDAALIVDDARVLEIFSRAHRALPAGTTHLDFGNAVLVPGYIDVHIHGSAGFDVMDASAEALPAIEQMLARRGVTSYFPTTVTAPAEITLRALERLAEAVEKAERRNADRTGRAAPLGIHLEGPFISHSRPGVHPPENLLPPKVESFERFWQAARGKIRVMTIAPELDGALELIRMAAARGVCVSLGHSDADFATTERAIATGASHATHTFNAMRPLRHRDPGIIGAVLTDARISADMVVDGIHLEPAIVKLVALAKGPEQTVLITDATAAAGMPDGRYRLGSMEVEVKNGACTLNGRLAGSVLTMDAAVRNFSKFTGWSLREAVAAASRNPARAVQLTKKGELRAGGDADFVVLNPRGEVLRTFVGGVEC